MWTFYSGGEKRTTDEQNTDFICRLDAVAYCVSGERVAMQAGIAKYTAESNTAAVD